MPPTTRLVPQFGSANLDNLDHLIQIESGHLNQIWSQGRVQFVIEEENYQSKTGGNDGEHEEDMRRTVGNDGDQEEHKDIRRRGEEENKGNKDQCHRCQRLSKQHCVMS